MEIILTASQREQLRTFLEEQDHVGPVDLIPAVNLPGGYVEAVLLDADGEETPTKRVLFP